MASAARQLLRRVKVAVSAIVPRADGLTVRWRRRSATSRLNVLFAGRRYKPTEICPYAEAIERYASETDGIGPLPIWEGYGHTSGVLGSRRPNGVRTQPLMGNALTRIVESTRPSVVVECGTAFGVSGMYLLAGLEAAHHGHLWTFDPNSLWTTHAERNLRRISDRFTLTVDTFERGMQRVLPPTAQVDIAFIDGIHERGVVEQQLEIVRRRAAPGAIVLLDDINFAGNMRSFWKEVSRSDAVAASVAIGGRLGILELSEG